MREKLKILLKREGFYIFLFLCVCILAVTSVWISRSNLNKMESQNDPIKTEDFIIVAEEGGENEEETLEMSKMVSERKENRVLKSEEENKKENEDEKEKEDDQIEKEIEKEDIKPPAIDTIETFAMPVEGKLITGFSTDNLVYSKTLEEWTTHLGIDIESKVGTAVKACANGRISDVYEDELWGIVIIIDHGNNLKSKYTNLSTTEMVKVGTRVMKGDAISGIGNPTGLELAEVPHLHFEVIQSGKNVDPKKYLPDYQ